MRGVRLGVAAALVASGIGFQGEVAMAQSPGPISAGAAKAAGAISVRRATCMATCKARGPTRTEADCAKWCTPGQCYLAKGSEYYCVRRGN